MSAPKLTASQRRALTAIASGDVESLYLYARGPSALVRDRNDRMLDRLRTRGLISMGDDGTTLTPAGRAALEGAS